MDFSDQRMSYEKGELTTANIPNNPLALLKFWLNEAIESGSPEPYAMSLATCGSDNMPAVRIVLLREVTESGIIFYTNYLSQKGEDIAQNPHAESLFFWHDMQRQIRVRGSIGKIDPAKSDAYFQKRPHHSQVGAWVSQPQSGVVENREKMEMDFAKLKQKYPEGTKVPTPEFWGGYEIKATEIEFWQGRANRMHDRLLFCKADAETDTKTEGGEWELKRLLP